MTGGGRDRPGKVAGKESAAGRARRPVQGARRPQPPSPADRKAAGCPLPPGRRRCVGHDESSSLPPYSLPDNKCQPVTAASGHESEPYACPRSCKLRGCPMQQKETKLVTHPIQSPSPRTRCAMNKLLSGLAALSALTLVAGCATDDMATGASVTRLHLGQPIARGAIAIESVDPRDANGLEF